MKQYIANHSVEAYDVKKGARVRVKKGESLHLNAMGADAKALVASGAVKAPAADAVRAVEKASKARSRVEVDAEAPLGDIPYSAL